MRALALSAVVVASALALAGAPADAVGVPLAAQLDSLVKGFSGGAGIWISDPTSGAFMYQRDPDRRLIAASLYKLAVLAEVERLVEAKRLSYESVITIEREDITDDGSYLPSGTDLTIDEALELMITVSDNGTALHLWRMVEPANINSTLAKAGMSAFHVTADDSDDNVATPRAVGRFFELLARRQLVSAAASDRMTKRLLRQRVNDRLPAQLPPDVRFAHKTGNLVGLVHDAGIVYTPIGPRVVVVMTWGAEDAQANDFIAHVASGTYAAITEPPVNARYTMPKGTQYVPVGTAASFPITVENAGERAWMLSGADRVALRWDLRRLPENTLVSRSAGPLPLGVLRPGASLEMPLVVTAPDAPGDLRLSVSLVDARGRDLTALGAATAKLDIRVHRPFVASADVRIPSVLHRGEASLLEVRYDMVAPVREDEHQLSLAWRAIDPRTQRAVAQGRTLLGAVKTHQRSGTLFAPLVAPNIRGTYILEYELREGELIASETERTTVEVLGPRTYPDEIGGAPRRR